MNNIYDFNKFKKKQEQKKIRCKISPELREKIFRVMDGHHEALPIIHQLLSFVEHERILDWLCENKITGKNLTEMYLKSCKASILTMGEFIIATINKRKPGGPVYAGKDFIVGP